MKTLVPPCEGTNHNCITRPHTQFHTYGHHSLSTHHLKARQKCQMPTTSAPSFSSNVCTCVFALVLASEMGVHFFHSPSSCRQSGGKCSTIIYYLFGRQPQQEQTHHLNESWRILIYTCHVRRPVISVAFLTDHSRSCKAIHTLKMMPNLWWDLLSSFHTKNICSWCVEISLHVLSPKKKITLRQLGNIFPVK